MNKPLVEVHGLSKRFDVSPSWLNRLFERRPASILTAVDDVWFNIPRGMTLGLVGESGCGKSTVARCLTGLLEPDEGRIIFDGTDLTRANGNEGRRSIRGRMQMIFQDPFSSLNPRWRVSRIIGEPIRTLRLLKGKAEVGPRVDQLLEEVGLSPADGRKYPHQFSGGQRQRIAIARSLASNPEFVVCDEPTSALDVSVQAQILNVMRELQDKIGLTYLLISHNLAVINYLSWAVGVMYLGCLVELRESSELFTKPLHPYTRMLLSSVPDPRELRASSAPPLGELPNPMAPPDGCAFHPRCAYARERCHLERPRLLEVSGGRVACHAVEEGRLP